MLDWRGPWRSNRSSCKISTSNRYNSDRTGQCHKDYLIDHLVNKILDFRIYLFTDTTFPSMTTLFPSKIATRPSPGQTLNGSAMNGA